MRLDGSLVAPVFARKPKRGPPKGKPNRGSPKGVNISKNARSRMWWESATAQAKMKEDVY